MLAYLAPAPLTFSGAVGEGLLSELQSLSALHSDGWGTAWVDPAGGVRQFGETTRLGDSGALAVRVPEASALRMAYLRFASRGAVPTIENVQPFLREGIAFQHNGALAPLDPARAMLGEAGAAGLRGSTDSEVYFALILSRVAALAGGVLPVPTPVLVEAVRQVAGELRAAYPAACLNAFVLTPSALLVVQSQGQAMLPLEAFARRGFAPGDLPPGHDDGYNVLRWTRTEAGVVVVATSGVDTTGWAPLGEGTVSVFVPDAGGASGGPVVVEI